MIQAVLFDLDGTLADTLPIIVPALQETFLRHAGREYSAEEINAMFGPSEEGVIMRRVPPERFDAALATYLDRYTALHAQVARPFDGVVELLASLRERGVRRAVITGKGPRTAEITLRVTGLAPLVERLETGDPSGVAKTEHIRRVLAAWQIPARAAAYVGDMPADMQCAREAGVRALGAAWSPSHTLAPGDADVMFERIHALREFLEGEQGVGDWRLEDWRLED